MSNNNQHSQPTGNGAAMNQSGEARNIKRDEGQTLSVNERKVISARWYRAVEDVKLEIEFSVPREYGNVMMTGFVRHDQSNCVTIRDVRLTFEFLGDHIRYADHDSVPWILVEAYHTGGCIVEDKGFEKGVSDAIAAYIQKPVAVMLRPHYFQENGYSALNCVQAASSWNVADYILRAKGY